MTAHDVTLAGLWAVIDRPYKGTRSLVEMKTMINKLPQMPESGIVIRVLLQVTVTFPHPGI